MKKPNIRRYSQKRIERSRVLIPPLIGKPFFAALTLIIILGSCQQRGPEPSEKPVPSLENYSSQDDSTAEKNEQIGTVTISSNPGKGKWFQFTPEGVVPISSVDELHYASEKKPWTNQIRGIKLFASGTDLYIGVNTLGIVKMKNIFLPNRKPTITEFFHPVIFKERTFENFFFNDDRLFCHVYYNTVFNQPPGPGGRPMSLAAFDLKKRQFKVIPFTFQDENTEWELIKLVPNMTGGDWDLVWKKTTKEETQIRYTKIDKESWQETKSDETTFLESITPLPLKQAPAPLQTLISEGEIINSKADYKQLDVYDITLSSSVPASEIIYRYGNIENLSEKEAKLHQLRGYVHKNTFYLLLPEGKILGYSESIGMFWIELPQLKTGFVYTDFVVKGRTYLVLWEEQSFTTVGAAGFYYSKEMISAK